MFQVESLSHFIRNRLSKQRPHLIGCLCDPSAEPTNNRAERSLRPAVIARKISCGNKTERGRIIWQILASLAATCIQRGEDLIDYITARIQLRQKMSAKRVLHRNDKKISPVGGLPKSTARRQD